MKNLALNQVQQKARDLDQIPKVSDWSRCVCKGVDNVNKSIWITPGSEGQVWVTRMAADPLNVRQQASRLDIRKQFYSQRVVDGLNKVPTDIKKTVWQWAVSKWHTKNTEENWRQPHRESRLEEGWGGCPPGVNNSLWEVPVGPTRLNLSIQVSKYLLWTPPQRDSFWCSGPPLVASETAAARGNSCNIGSKFIWICI